ncbi:MAG: response regulator, partial [Xanthomonadales bacterium]|nr:response regulator [Xanthomonadales bacterium]
MTALRDILVIEDEPMVTQAVVMVCGEEGMTVTAVDSAAEALRYMQVSGFRLVLCDIMMQGMDGFQFLDELARNGIHTPV